MKKIQIIRNVFYLAFILSGSSCCKSKPCTSSSQSLGKSVNLFDVNAFSQYYNKVVASFQFTQNNTTYTSPNECSTCPSSESQVVLTVTNTTDKKISFDYNIVFSLNAVSWSNQGFATIAPHGQYNAGVVSNNMASVSLGQISIQSKNISYQ